MISLRAACIFAPAVFLLGASTALAGDAQPSDDLKAAAAFVFQAFPGQCDERDGSDASGLIVDDQAYKVAWKSSYDGSGDDEHGTLYRIFCYAGAYNIASVFAFRQQDGDFELVSFAEPKFSIEYEDGDETYTKLKAPPEVSGYGTTYMLVNAEFIPEKNLISSYSKWRGIGDAWTQGDWELRDGQFILAGYSVDPIYEGNLDSPSDEQTDKNFVLYPDRK